LAEPDSPWPEKCSSDDHHDVWILAHELRLTRWDPVQPPTHQLSRQQLTRSSGSGFTSIAMRSTLVAVVAAGVDPLQSVRRPHSAPAVVVGGIGVGGAEERKAMEAVMEEAVMEVVVVSEREP
jgi:hypothetical protein